MAEKALAARDTLKGQRRQVTALFTHLAGFTPLAERLGKEGIYLLMQPVFKEMIEAMHAHEGTVQELTGDGIIALFGAPAALGSL